MCTPDSDVLCVCNMQFLYLSYNQIGDTGMHAFATALAGGAMAQLQASLLPTTLFAGPKTCHVDTPDSDFCTVQYAGTYAQ